VSAHKQTKALLLDKRESAGWGWLVKVDVALYFFVLFNSLQEEFSNQ
jgi:hypothetical protein